MHRLRPRNLRQRRGGGGVRRLPAGHLLLFRCFDRLRRLRSGSLFGSRRHELQLPACGRVRGGDLRQRRSVRPLPAGHLLLFSRFNRLRQLQSGLLFGRWCYKLQRLPRRQLLRILRRFRMH